jgi:hypothetical protein
MSLGIEGLKSSKRLSLWEEGEGFRLTDFGKGEYQRRDYVRKGNEHIVSWIRSNVPFFFFLSSKGNVMIGIEGSRSFLVAQDDIIDFLKQMI